jgi:hypothetical protein
MTYGMFSKHLAFEIGFNKILSSDQFGMMFDVSIRRNTDHPGVFFMFYIWKFGFEFNIYDIRHREDIIS